MTKSRPVLERGPTDTRLRVGVTPKRNELVQNERRRRIELQGITTVHVFRRVPRTHTQPLIHTRTQTHTYGRTQRNTYPHRHTYTYGPAQIHTQTHPRTYIHTDP